MGRVLTHQQARAFYDLCVPKTLSARPTGLAARAETRLTK